MSKIWSYELDVNPDMALKTIYANTKNDPMQTNIDAFSGKTWLALANPNEENMKKLLRESDAATEFCGYVSEDAFQVGYLPDDAQKRCLFEPYVLGVANAKDFGCSLICELRYQKYGFRYVLYMGFLMAMLFFFRELYTADYFVAGVFGVLFFPIVFYNYFKNRNTVALHEQKLQEFLPDLFKEHLLSKKDLPENTKEDLPDMELTTGVDIRRIVLLTLYFVTGLIFAGAIAIYLVNFFGIPANIKEFVIGPLMLIFLGLYVATTGIFFRKKKNAEK
ncbi:hypothetical protein [Candidatus Uabimicrobium amorphum]|uniref:Uncharacterized protein n=1 Tax=Uabimicrobium amorphum TaxID=2596890 RepID=A0A5S9IPR3_UABAM|nr:hypothetical protein [Candidatus Uabimicrobium amorphum]BBM85799.1 hypothetical protein UABAM_04177 [Candidatus Uabimicrobium amorphum]